jgi:hypothetical protein
MGLSVEKFKLTIDDKGKIDVWMDGCLIHGIRSMELFWEVGEVPYHKLEFVTQATEIKRKFSEG